MLVERVLPKNRSQSIARNRPFPIRASNHQRPLPIATNHRRRPNTRSGDGTMFGSSRRTS
ncbi:hypothetical protein DNX69_14985 [Rhodopseudomonas palustris]|uniref:Uncharacterized protein n=1 Tax=Rhodopseudomonas palustris TaxID=1076 RepID=A0A323UT00_RHOPL|nr:hypothetical protein DNX69_14985 [Rhodopseudomonas palustris]